MQQSSLEYSRESEPSYSTLSNMKEITYKILPDEAISHIHYNLWRVSVTSMVDKSY